MPSFLPETLAVWTGGRWTRTPGDPLTAFTTDTRQLRPGQVFVALKTDRRDGHAFLGAAQLIGASAAIVNYPNRSLVLPQLIVPDSLQALQTIAREHRRSFHGPVIGITGSAGKTSTKELLALLLGGPDAGVLATEGNLNNHLGVPLTLLRLEPGRHTRAVIEAGISAPGEMRVLAGMVEPDLALVTLVSPAHLADLGGLDVVAREKAVLAASVRPRGLALFSAQCTAFSAFRDLGVRRLVLEPTHLPPAVPSSDGRAFFAVAHGAAGTSLTLFIGSQPPFSIALRRRVSDGMAQNAALAVAAALHLGEAREALPARLAAWSPSPLRGEWRSASGRRLYIDCYNANPAAMTDALATFCSVAPPEEPRLFVIGCMEELGSDSAVYHRELGRSLHLRSGDRLFVIGAQAAAVRDGALEHGNAAAQIEVVESLAPVAARVAEFRGSVFVKGSRRYQLEKAFEEVPVAAEALHA